MELELSQQLKNRRVQAGLSQEEVARTVFVSRQTISNWETGKTYPDVQSLLLLSNLYGVSIDTLIKGDVAAMQKTVHTDSAKLNVLTTAAVTLTLVGIIFFGIFFYGGTGPSPVYGLSMGKYIGAILFGCLFVPALICFMWATRIRRQHSLDTFADVLAYMNGETKSDTGKMRSRVSWQKRLGFAVMGVIAGIVLSLVIYAIVGACIGWYY